MRYHNITKDDMRNGPGLRTVLWLAGCKHGCKGCHNKITWDPNGGVPFDEKAKAELFMSLRQPYISGITFTGGDPLHENNISEVEELAKTIKENYPDKTVWLYTGSVWDDIYSLSIIQYLDVVVDGQFVEELADWKFHWGGSTNQRVIDVRETLATDTPDVPVLYRD